MASFRLRMKAAKWEAVAPDTTIAFGTAHRGPEVGKLVRREPMAAGRNFEAAARDTANWIHRPGTEGDLLIAGFATDIAMGSQQQMVGAENQQNKAFVRHFRSWTERGCCSRSACRA